MVTSPYMISKLLDGLDGRTGGAALQGDIIPKIVCGVSSIADCPGYWTCGDRGRCWLSSWVGDGWGITWHSGKTHCFSRRVAHWILVVCRSWKVDFPCTCGTWCEILQAVWISFIFALVLSHMSHMQLGILPVDIYQPPRGMKINVK